jgi:Na+/pantothenate symporter
MDIDIQGKNIEMTPIAAAISTIFRCLLIVSKFMVKNLYEN